MHPCNNISQQNTLLQKLLRNKLIKNHLLYTYFKEKKNVILLSLLKNSKKKKIFFFFLGLNYLNFFIYHDELSLFVEYNYFQIFLILLLLFSFIYSFKLKFAIWRIIPNLKYPNTLLTFKLSILLLSTA